MPLSGYIHTHTQSSISHVTSLALEPAERLEHKDLWRLLEVLRARLHGLGHVLRLAVRLDGLHVLVARGRQLQCGEVTAAGSLFDDDDLLHRLVVEEGVRQRAGLVRLDGGGEILHAGGDLWRGQLSPNPRSGGSTSSSLPSLG